MPIMSAIAAKLRTNVARSTGINWQAFPRNTSQGLRGEIRPSRSSDTVDYFGTSGPTGAATISLEVYVELPALDAETAAKVATDLLSVGTGNTSSVPDALLRTNHTLGGLIEDLAVLTGTWEINDDGPDVVWFPVFILTRKQGAEV